MPMVSFHPKTVRETTDTLDAFEASGRVPDPQIIRDIYNILRPLVGDILPEPLNHHDVELTGAERERLHDLLFALAPEGLGEEDSVDVVVGTSG